MNHQKINSNFCSIKTGNINYKESTIKSLLALNAGENFCQIVPANKACSFNQAFFAFEQATDAIEKKTAFSEKPELEFLIRFFGTKQINAALGLAEMKTGKNTVLLVCAQKEQKKLDELFAKAKKELGFEEKKIQLGKNKKELMEIYGIPKNALESMKGQKNALEKLVIEKNALVVFQS